MQQALAALFFRDLTRLHQEIEAYPDDETLWRVADGISNSAGNLVLHLMGNLNSYLGATLGQTGYVRNREAEFSTKNLSKQELLGKIEATRRVVETVVQSLSDEQLAAPFPIEVLGYPMSTQYFLVHIHGHLNYHLGQIDYHRRLLVVGGAIEFVN
ncbi:MAG: DinB family protein [Sphingobacteriaceae bacterium]|nr:DinB family protein [Cytophagaceae bacterium]